MICPHCNQNIHDDCKFCTICGKKIPRCPECGFVITKGFRFCPKDGTRIPDEILELLAEESADAVQSMEPEKEVLPEAEGKEEKYASAAVDYKEEKYASAKEWCKEDRVVPASEEYKEDGVVPASEDRKENGRFASASEDRKKDGGFAPTSEDRKKDEIVPTSEEYKGYTFTSAEHMDEECAPAAEPQDDAGGRAGMLSSAEDSGRIIRGEKQFCIRCGRACEVGETLCRECQKSKAVPFLLMLLILLFLAAAGVTGYTLIKEGFPLNVSEVSEPAWEASAAEEAPAAE